MLPAGCSGLRFAEGSLRVSDGLDFPFTALFHSHQDVRAALFLVPDLLILAGIMQPAGMKICHGAHLMTPYCVMVFDSCIPESTTLKPFHHRLVILRIRAPVAFAEVSRVRRGMGTDGYISGYTQFFHRPGIRDCKLLPFDIHLHEVNLRFPG